MKLLLPYVCCVLFVLLLAPLCSAAGIPTERFNYRQDFEDTDPVTVSPAAKAGTYQINFKGLTSERQTSGNKAFKLDLTFTEDATVSWRVYLPQQPPAEGRLRFSGQLYVDPQTTAVLPGAVRSAPMFNYPPSTVIDSANGTNAAFYRPAEKGRWVSVEQDVVGNAKKVSNLHIYDWGDPNVSHVGAYMTAYIVTLVGKKGERVVVYFDNFEVNGEVFTKAAFEEEINKRWEPIKKKVLMQLQVWESQLAGLRSDLANVNVQTDELANQKTEATALATKLAQTIQQVRDRGAMQVKVAEQCDADTRKLATMVSNLRYQSQTQNKPKGMLITTVPPISAIPVMPSATSGFNDIIGVVGDTLAVTATPGEYEPASFVVYAQEEINRLEVRVGDLKKGTDIIPNESIDVKVVKRWYQAGTAWSHIKQNKEQKVLVPELLLNDDTLVKVDQEKQENYLRLDFPTETKYVWISDPAEATKRHGNTPPESTILSLTEFPVKDSPVLLPVSISAGENKQFWLTVQVPEGTPAGTYTGEIGLYTGDVRLGKLQLKVNVLPFTLDAPYYTSSLYYRGMLDPDGIGSISSEWKSEAQMRKELANMVAHGVTNPRVRLETRPWAEGFDLAGLEKVLQIREEAGMGGQDLHLSYGYNLNYTISYYDTPERLSGLQHRVSDELLPLARKYGISDVYIYGIDEARGTALTDQRRAWEAIKAGGAKVEVSGFRGQFELVGDILDVSILEGKIDKAEADKWHSVGHKIYSYGNPQVGVENPEVYRRNYGLSLWKHGYDGACTWTYHMSFGNIWNDFDNEKWRDHNFTYPTVDGVINTIAWEGYREGVDDVRYLTTLLRYIDKVKASGISEAKLKATSAETYLAELAANLEHRDLSTVRAEIVDHILGLL